MKGRIEINKRELLLMGLVLIALATAAFVYVYMAQGVITPRVAAYFVIAGVLLSGFIIAGDLKLWAETRTKAFIKEHDIRFDFGLAPREEVIAKFGEEVGEIILEERRLVFYRFGWLWSIVGALILLIFFLVR